MKTPIAALAALTSIASAQDECLRYEIETEIVGVACSDDETSHISPWHMSEDGVVVGSTFCPPLGAEHPFIWYGHGEIELLPLPQGSNNARALDINSNGRIVGYGFLAGGSNRQACAWIDGTVTVLPPLPGHSEAEALGINDEGIIVGYSRSVDGTPVERATMWIDGAPIDHGIDFEPEPSRFIDITDTGTVAGYTGGGGGAIAFLLADDRITTLGPIPEGLTSQARAVSSRGVICGRGLIQAKDGSYVRRAFIGSASPLVILDLLGRFRFSEAWGISDAGVVGWVSSHPELLMERAVLWSESGEVDDLNALLTPMSLDPYQQLRYAWGIGPDGRIVAQTTVRTLVLSPTRNPRGDLDGDCMIGPSDVVLLLRAWGSDDTAADLDADGVVGVSDLLDLVMRWDF